MENDYFGVQNQGWQLRLVSLNWMPIPLAICLNGQSLLMETWNADDGDVHAGRTAVQDDRLKGRAGHRSGSYHIDA